MTLHRMPALLSATGRAALLLAAVQVLAWPGMQWPFALCNTAASALLAHAARHTGNAPGPDLQGAQT